MSREVIYRPNNPVGLSGQSMGWPPNSGAYYQVTQHEVIVAAYNLLYFRSISEVVSDLIELIKAGLITGPWGEDYAVWYAGRLMAAIHQPMDAMHQRIILFNDPRNDPAGVGDHVRPAGWPSYEQWVAEGRGDIVYDLERYPKAGWDIDNI